MFRARVLSAALLASTALGIDVSAARSATPDPVASAMPALAKPALVKPSLSPGLTSSPTPVAAAHAMLPANPVAATLASQVGSWDCSIAYPGATDDEKLVVTWAEYGTNWIRGSTNVPVVGRRPAHRADFAFGYDTAQKIWVSVYTDSLGAYSVSKSSAAPSAKKMTFTDAYPLDSHDGPSIVTFGPETATVDSAWEIAGVSHSSHESCEKI